MDFLRSNVPPMAEFDSRKVITDMFKELLKQSDELVAAVGYISTESLIELDHLIEEYGIKHIVLILGMYYAEGMPEKAYRTALKINEKWIKSGIGEIRVVIPFKYHGKIYIFSKNHEPAGVIIGSSNLSFLKATAENRRQYETACFTNDSNFRKDIDEHTKKLSGPSVSRNIADIPDFPLIKEMNTSLTGIELVSVVPMSNVEFYKNCRPLHEISLPLKVPASTERFLDDGKHFTKSNINVAYAAPRNKRKARDWYETQLTVSKAITREEGYPERNIPFFIITDDGYWFKAHTTSDNNKQFSAVGDELIMGRWIKGRLAAAGIVNPVNNTLEDTERTGMITREMLDEYGRDHLSLKDTGQTALDKDGNPLKVWLLSFEAKKKD